MNNLNISYTGKVNVTLGKTRKELTNSGTPKLFKLISILLTGGFDNQSISSVKRELPSCIMLYNNSKADVLAGTATLNPLLRSTVDFTRYYSNDATDCYSYFTCILTDSYFNDAVISETSCSLAILNQAEDSILAVVDFAKDYVDSIKIGKQALIEWKMIFTNSED